MSNRTIKDAGLWPEKAAVKTNMKKTIQNEFPQIYSQYVTRIYRYIYARAGNKEAAEELTAQVFLAALQAYPNYKKTGSLPAWLFTIARNKMVDAYRRERRFVPLEDLDELPADAPDHLTDVIAQENAAELKVILSRLPEDQRELLELRYAGELSYREIGRIVGKSEGSVKMAVNRLIKKLQTELENDHV